ncbi:MAG: BMP family protein [Lachnospiraceae bacterium]|nr:BMP family protein [Lachnospiraceae bacterium]
MKKGFLTRMLAGALSAAMVLAMAGCGSSSSSSSTSDSAEETEEEAEEVSSDIKVALILPGTANDKGWNQEAYDGLLEIEEAGIETAYAESVAASDYETTFRAYADQGYDVIIGHGSEFEDAASKVAEEYPDLYFGCTSSDIYAEPNLFSLQNLNNEQGFIAGVVAALATETGIVAAIGGMEVPSIQSYILGFEQGVAYVDNGTTALTCYVGTFDDATKVKEQALAYVEQGADIVTHDADEAGLGLFEAIAETPDGVYAIGAVKDQYEECPDKVLTSATNAIGSAMAKVVEDYANGTDIEAICYKYGIAAGVIGLADWHNCADVLTDEEKAYVDEVMEMIANGDIVVESAQN